MEIMIDSHVHLDHYKDQEISMLIETSPFIDAFITVSFDLISAKRNLFLSQKYANVYPAFGFHPEQPLPADQEKEELIRWMETHLQQMIAIGEIGLPYYRRRAQASPLFPLPDYIELLDTFIQLAAKWNKPVILHAVYDDAPIVCDILERHSIDKAHFHWYKGDKKTTERLISNGYFISFTPDIIYENEIQTIAKAYPLEKIMVETDGPWPFEGPFQGQITHPKMMHETIKTVSEIKCIHIDEVYKQLLRNTKNFYSIKNKGRRV